MNLKDLEKKIKYYYRQDYIKKYNYLPPYRSFRRVKGKKYPFIYIPTDEGHDVIGESRWHKWSYIRVMRRDFICARAIRSTEEEICELVWKLYKNEFDFLAGKPSFYTLNLNEDKWLPFGHNLAVNDDSSEDATPVHGSK